LLVSQLLAANRASSEAEISSLRHQLTSLQAAKPSVTPSIPNTTVCQCAEARKQCYSSLIDTRLEADQLRASLTELRAQLDSEVRKATLHAEQEVAQCRTNVMDIQQVFFH
jgi:hypothetical protein